MSPSSSGGIFHRLEERRRCLYLLGQTMRPPSFAFDTILPVFFMIWSCSYHHNYIHLQTITIIWPQRVVELTVKIVSYARCFNIHRAEAALQLMGSIKRDRRHVI